MSTVACLVMPGIGAADPTPDARTLMDAVAARLAGTGVEVRWAVADWRAKVTPGLEAMFDRTAAGGAWTALDRFLFLLGGEVETYRRGDGVYAEVQETLLAACRPLLWNLSVNSLVVFAHSLGTLIATDWIYDCQRAHLDAAFPFLVTAGSPIAMYAGAYPNGGTPPKVPIWRNLYAGADLVAKKLRPIGPGYSSVVDVEVKVPGVLDWTPACHTAYWSSSDVADELAAVIQQAGGAA